MNKNNNILTDEQWSQLCEVVNIFDQKGDRTLLNQVLVSLMTTIIYSLAAADDEDDHKENELAITLIESEVAQLIDVNGGSGWFCRRQRIQPFIQNNQTFANYLINLARAKSLDANNTGFIPKQTIKNCFAAQLNEKKMAELLQFVDMDNNGNIDYKDFALLMFIMK
ncbi:unnamed protein product [Adineta steineri]|uniref:EF-hand domain-containing protein n=1 Tax=Adineta steineri TaxID=433720 RepID=A0A818S7C6_9BILA|nr:unnamed protein product [Adineta steineri]CAF1209698.1 unnamed protein product [Adineta steineri]CAF3665413.1 unnamed protein product [Adineta steineri]